MKLKIEFSKKTSYKWFASSVANDRFIISVLAHVQEKIRYQGFATYETLANELGIPANRAYLTCGWMNGDIIDPLMRPIKDGIILEIECREDIRFI